MAVENYLWGAERIRGELLKLGIEVSKRTIQKYMPKARPSHVASHIVPMPLRETWATFLKNQAGEIWACDFARRVQKPHPKHLGMKKLVSHRSSRM
jgi:hypothetical protein